MDYTLNIVSKCRFLFIFKHSLASKRSWKIFHGGPGKSWKSRRFFVSKRVETVSLVSVQSWVPESEDIQIDSSTFGALLLSVLAVCVCVVLCY